MLKTISDLISVSYNITLWKIAWFPRQAIQVDSTDRPESNLPNLRQLSCSPFFFHYVFLWRFSPQSGPETPLNCPTATQYAQIVCRVEKKLAKHIGGEEFLQCSSMILLDKQVSTKRKSSRSSLKTCLRKDKICLLNDTFLY